jgi:hypothetical protein
MSEEEKTDETTGECPPSSKENKTVRQLKTEN